MSFNTRIVTRARSLASGGAPLRLSSRSYSASAYPFTKPASATGAPAKTTVDQDAKSAYPFTNPHEPTQIASPTRPVSRPGPSQDDSAVISRDAREESSFAKPDYSVLADSRISNFSPVPLRVRDGSEPTETTAAAVVSGAPIELQARTVRIFKPTKSAMQSGDWHSHHWQMDWDILGKGHRWENPLMGWQSSGDMMQGTKLNFKSKEDAIRFAEKQGYEYFVQEPQQRKIVPKSYSTQFLHTPGKLKQIRTK